MKPNPSNSRSEDKPITKEELGAWGGYVDDYFCEVLNGEKSAEKAKEDLLSFRNSKWYTGDDSEFQEIKEKD